MKSRAREFVNSISPVIGRELMANFTNKLSQIGETARNKLPQSATTVFTFKYNGGVIIAGDRRMVGGWYSLESDREIKVKQLSPHIALACSGYCSVIRYIEDNMETISSTFIQRFEKELSPDGAANYLRYLLEEWFFALLWLGYWAIGAPILATYDIGPDKPRIFEFSEDGFFHEPQFVAGTGCGYSAVKHIIADECMRKGNMNENDAINLAMRAMFHSGIASHGVSDIRLGLPTIGLIDRDGFRWVPEEELKNERINVLTDLGETNA